MPLSSDIVIAEINEGSTMNRICRTIQSGNQVSMLVADWEFEPEENWHDLFYDSEY